MKVLVTYHKPCEGFYIHGDCMYVGMRMSHAGLCHLFKHGGEERLICSRSCVVKELLERTYVLKVGFDGRYIRVYVYDNYAARKLLEDRGHPYTVVDWRRLSLTPRERDALRLFTQMRLSGVAKRLGISKGAASKLIKRALAKVVNW